MTPDPRRKQTLADLDAERAVLASVMLSGGCPNSMLGKLRDLGVDAATFADPRHGTVWDAFIALDGKRTPIDLITLPRELRERQRLNTIGGTQYLGELTDFIPSLVNSERHAELVLDSARVRLAVDVVLEMYSVLTTGAGSASEVLDRARHVATRLPTGPEYAKGVSFADHFMAAWEETERDAIARASGKLVTARFGVDALDGDASWEGLLGGLFRQNILSLLGPPGTGKTTLALQAVVTTAEDALRTAGGNLAKAARSKVFATEMRGPQVSLRVACLRAGVSFARLRNGTATSEERDQVFHAGNHLAGLPIDIIDTRINGGTLTADDVRRHVMAAKAKHAIDLVVVDYFQDLAPCRDLQRENSTEERKQRAKRLHDVTVDADVAMVVISSMNKEGQKASRGGQANLTAADGAGIEYSSDTVATLYAVDHEDRGGCVEVVLDVSKARYSALGKVTLMFDKTHGRFNGKIVRRGETDPEASQPVAKVYDFPGQARASNDHDPRFRDTMPDDLYDDAVNDDAE